MSEARPVMRGRRGRERRVAEEIRERPDGTTARHRIPDLSGLTALLVQAGELTALVDRLRPATRPGVGAALRHVSYAAMPHGAMRGVRSAP